MKMFLMLWKCYSSCWVFFFQFENVWVGPSWSGIEGGENLLMTLCNFYSEKEKKKQEKKYLAFNKIFPSKKRYLLKKLSCGPLCRNSFWWCKPSAQLPKVSHCSIFSLRCLLACLLDDRFRVLWTTHQGSQTAI